MKYAYFPALLMLHFLPHPLPPAQVGVFRRNAVTCAMRDCQKWHLVTLLGAVILSCRDLWTAHASALEFLGEPDLALGI